MLLCLNPVTLHPATLHPATLHPATLHPSPICVVLCCHMDLPCLTKAVINKSNNQSINQSINGSSSDSLLVAAAVAHGDCGRPTVSEQRRQRGAHDVGVPDHHRGLARYCHPAPLQQLHAAQGCARDEAGMAPTHQHAPGWGSGMGGVQGAGHKASEGRMRGQQRGGGGGPVPSVLYMMDPMRVWGGPHEGLGWTS